MPASAVAIAAEVARAAGEILLRYRRGETGLEVRHKGAIDLVTAADHASERLIRAELARRTPQYGFLGEEDGGAIAADRPSWVVDPLDGTTNFIHGHPVFAVSIALVEMANVEVNGQQRRRAVPTAGCVYAPVLGECFTASRGGGAFCNGAPIAVSTVDALDDALLCTGFPYAARERSFDECARGFSAFLRAAQAVRRDGSAALDMAYVAAGRYDGFFEVGIRPWDVAAGICLAREAGGTTSGYRGEPVDLDGRNFVVSNGALHGQMLDLLAQTYPDLDWLQELR